MKTMDVFFNLLERAYFASYRMSAAIRHKTKNFLVGKPGELIISLTPEAREKLQQLKSSERKF